MLRVASVRPQSTTAGLSPNEDKRTEVFLAGCRMALSGHPCPGCFNVDLWDPKYFPEVSPAELLEDVKNAAINRLGMHYPDSEHMRYYTLTDDSYVRQYTDVSTGQ